MMEDPEHVAISQATFTRVEKDGKVEWSKPDTDGYVGEFGRIGRPEQIDEARKAQAFTTGDGRYLLAVPTRDFVNGTDVGMFSLLLFDPGSVDKLGFRQWGYLGSIPVSDDNSDACDGGQVMPCVASTGTLKFEQVGEGLPRLKVSSQGTTIIFTLKSRKLDEFEPMCEDHQVSPLSHFTRKKVISLARPQGRITLTNHTLKINDGDGTEIIPIANNEFKHYLQNYFNIHLKSDLAD